MLETIFAMTIKAKAFIMACLAAYVAATMRYIKYKREGKQPKVNDSFLFGITAFLVTYTFFSLAEYVYPTAPNNLVAAIGFWVGYMSDYFYSWVPKYIKSKLPKDDINK